MHNSSFQKNKLKSCIAIILGMAITACGSSSTTKTKTQQAVNTAPVVTLAETNTFMQSAKVSLSASVTDSNLSTISWELLEAPAGVDITITNKSAANAHFLAPNVLGEYKFSITATDSEGLASTKETTVTVVGIEEYLTPKLEQLMQETYQQHKEGTANMAFNVSFDDLDFAWQSAVGLADVSAQRTMTTQDAFRIASVSKTVTVATALKMIENGYFELDTPIGELLTDDDLPVGYSVDDLHVKDGVKRGSSITIRQLMDQSSGIKDFISYLLDPLAPGTLEFTSTLSEPNNSLPELWTPQHILSNILDRGLTKNLDYLPGEKHLYGNSNTDLLAIILEKVGNAPLHVLMAENVFIPLNMTNTVMDFHQVSDITPVDHFFPVTEANYGTDMPSYMYGNHNVKELEVNTSFAWAGGGLVSTLDDLDRFFAAIMHNTLILDEQLQKEWREWKLPDGDEEYGLGLAMGSFEVNNSEYKYRGHGGAWGLQATIIDPIDIRIISWVGQAGSPAEIEFGVGVLTLLSEMGYKYTSF